MVEDSVFSTLSFLIFSRAFSWANLECLNAETTGLGFIPIDGGFGKPAAPTDFSAALPLVLLLLLLLPGGSEGLARFKDGLGAPTGLRAEGLGKAVLSLSFAFSNLAPSLSTPELTFRLTFFLGMLDQGFGLLLLDSTPPLNEPFTGMFILALALKDLGGVDTV